MKLLSGIIKLANWPKQRNLKKLKSKMILEFFENLKIVNKSSWNELFKCIKKHEKLLFIFIFKNLFL